MKRAFYTLFEGQKYFKKMYRQNKKCIVYTKNVVKHIFNKSTMFCISDEAEN